MAKCKTAVSPLLMHWRYCSLALNHRYIQHIDRKSIYQLLNSQKTSISHGLFMMINNLYSVMGIFLWVRNLFNSFIFKTQNCFESKWQCFGENLRLCLVIPYNRFHSNVAKTCYISLLQIWCRKVLHMRYFCHHWDHMLTCVLMKNLNLCVVVWISPTHDVLLWWRTVKV